jgi:hypothetical protein
MLIDFQRHVMVWWHAVLCLIYCSVIFRGEDKWLYQRQLAPCCRVPEARLITRCGWFPEWHPDKRVRQYSGQVLHRGPELVTTEFHWQLTTDHVRITRISLLPFVTQWNLFKLELVKFHHTASLSGVVTSVLFLKMSEEAHEMFRTFYIHSAEWSSYETSPTSAEFTGFN